MASGVRPPFIGKYVGTGAAITKDFGFRPHEVEIFDDNATVAVYAKWCEGMKQGAGHKVTTATAIMTAGITVTDTGVKIGTDASINESGKTYTIVAR
jgi:hypothetical protein